MTGPELRLQLDRPARWRRSWTICAPLICALTRVANRGTAADGEITRHAPSSGWDGPVRQARSRYGGWCPQTAIAAGAAKRPRSELLIAW